MSISRVFEKVFMIKREGTRGTAEAASTGARSLPVLPASEISLNPNILPDSKIYGDSQPRQHRPGIREWGGTLELEPGADKIGELLNSLLGEAATVETAAIVITINTNDFIDFDEGAGALAAQIVAGTYAIGVASSEAGSLCKAIKDALELVGDGTYTVAYSRTTRKFTITKSAGTFNILWLSGANKAKSAGTTLGYSILADDTGALFYVSDTTVDSVYMHTWTPTTTAQKPLYTIFVDRQVEAKKYNGCAARQMTFNVPLNARLGVSADMIAKSEAAGEDLTPDFSSDLENLMFSDVAVEVAGAANSSVRQASVVVNGNAIGKRALTASRDAADILHGKLDVTGSFQLYYEDAVERDKFVASTTSALKLTATGQILIGVARASLEIHVPTFPFTAGPVGEADGIQVQDFTFNAQKDSVSDYTVRVKLQNKVPSYA